jgi:hypothetical protein
VQLLAGEAGKGTKAVLQLPCLRPAAPT